MIHRGGSLETHVFDFIYHHHAKEGTPLKFFVSWIYPINIELYPTWFLFLAEN
jgi:hypothetical protein